METQKILIEIDVDATQSTQEIVKQRAALEELRKEKAELLAQNKLLAAQENVDTETIQKNNAAIVEKEAKIKNLSAEIKSNEKIVQAATKTTQDETGAYQKLALEYQVAAQKAKDLAVVHGVNSEEAKKATAAANAMDAQLKEVDKSVGQNQRSVGNYKIALSPLPGVFGDIQTKAIATFDSMKDGYANVEKLIKDYVASMIEHKAAQIASKEAASAAAVAENTLRLAEAEGTATAEMAAAAETARAVATNAATTATSAGAEAMKILKFAIASTGIGVLVIALGALVTYFTSTNEGAKNFKIAMGAVNAVIQEGLKVIGSFGKIVYDVLTGNVKEMGDDVKKFADNIKGFTGNVKESAKAGSELVEQRYALTKAEREWKVERVKIEGEIGVLEKQASKQSSLTMAEKVAAAKKAKELRIEMYDNDLKYSKKNEELINKEQSLNSKKDYQAVADAKIRTAQLTANKDNEIQSILNKEGKANKGLESEAKNHQKEIEAIETARIKTSENVLKLLQDEYKKNYDKEKLLDTNYLNDKLLALDVIKNKELELISQKKLTIEEQKLASAAADKEYLDAKNKLYSDLNTQLASNIDYQLKLDDLKNKQSLVGTKQTEEQKYQATVSGINKRYEADKKKIELTVKDESEKNEKLALLNAQYNLDIATANQANQDAIDKQKLIDEAELLQSKFELQQNGIDKEYQQKFDSLEKEKKERLAKVTAGSEAEFAIKQEYAAKEAELERQKNLAKAQAIVDIAAKTMEVLEAVNKFFDALGERELDNFKKLKDKELNITIENNNKAFDSVTANYNSELLNLNEQLANKLISQEDYDAAKKKLDADYADAKKSLDDKNKEAEKKAQDEIDEKKAEIEYQAAKRAKALAIANAIINGAAAIIAALATPFAGPGLAIAAGIMAAANLATIIATPIPDNRKGTSSSTSGGSNPTTTAGVPNTANTTNGIVNGNTSNNNAVTTAIVTGNQNDTTNYVPVLVTSDLTYEFDKSAKIEVMNQLN